MKSSSTPPCTNGWARSDNPKPSWKRNRSKSHGRPAAVLINDGNTQSREFLPTSPVSFGGMLTLQLTLNTIVTMSKACEKPGDLRFSTWPLLLEAHAVLLER